MNGGLANTRKIAQRIVAACEWASAVDAEVPYVL